MTQIKDVMSQNFKFVTPETNLQDAAQMMRDQDFGFLPVGENDRLIGMVTDRDIVIRSTAQGKNPAEETVRGAMTPKTFYCYADQPVEEIVDNMAEIKVRRMPVMNREKRMVGVVSLGDVAQACNRAKTGNAIQEITVGNANQPNTQAA